MKNADLCPDGMKQESENRNVNGTHRLYLSKIIRTYITVSIYIIYNIVYIYIILYILYTIMYILIYIYIYYIIYNIYIYIYKM